MAQNGFGALLYDSTAAQRRFTLAVAMGGVALAVICAGLARVSWTNWQWALVLFVAFDLLGGVASMCLPPTIRKIRPPGEPWKPILFCVFHVQPLVLAFALPDRSWTILLAVYAAGALGVLIVTMTSSEFRASAALAWCAGALAAITLWGAPPGLKWLAPAYVLKLVGSHAAGQKES